MMKMWSDVSNTKSATIPKHQFHTRHVSERRGEIIIFEPNENKRRFKKIKLGSIDDRLVHKFGTKASNLTFRTYSSPQSSGKLN